MTRSGFVIPLGRVEISMRLVMALLACLIIPIFMHIGLVSIGLTSWLGIERFEVEGSPRLPASHDSVGIDTTRLGLRLPMFAPAGHKLLVHYDLAANNSSQSPIKVVARSYCLCSHENWQDATISGPGQGVIALPVTKQDFYLVWISQSSAADGATSVGTYKFGVGP